MKGVKIFSHFLLFSKIDKIISLIKKPKSNRQKAKLAPPIVSGQELMLN